MHDTLLKYYAYETDKTDKMYSLFVWGMVDIGSTYPNGHNLNLPQDKHFDYISPQS